MHQSVINMSIRYEQELSRPNYVTPAAYLDLLGVYIILMKTKRQEIRNSITRLSTGMQKMESTGFEVKELQKTLDMLKPKLEIAVADTKVMIEAIAKDTVSTME